MSFDTTSIPFLLTAGANPNRTTRIFVARISPHVSDDQFRSYFAQYGAVQDAYMPKDASKLGHRGIGFVTFASPDSVEKVAPNPLSTRWVCE